MNNGGNVTCTYFFFDQNGIPFEATSSAELISELGLLGVFVDPVVVQLPLSASILTATYDPGTGPLPLVVTSGLSAVPVQPGTQLISEAGQQLCILEFPASVPPGLPPGPATAGTPFSFSVGIAGPSPLIQVKAIFSGKVVVGGQTYYPPLFPCVTDFASVPAISLTGASTLNLMSTLLGLMSGPNLGCSGTVYNYAAVASTPTPTVTSTPTPTPTVTATATPIPTATSTPMVSASPADNISTLDWRGLALLIGLLLFSGMIALRRLKS